MSKTKKSICNWIALLLILIIWSIIICFHVGIIFNPWIYEKMMTLEKQKSQFRDKYLESSYVDISYPLTENGTLEDFTKALSSDDNKVNYTAVYYMLYFKTNHGEDFIAEVTPYLISFLEKKGNLLKRDSIYLLDKYRIQEASSYIRPFLESENPYIRIAAKEYFRTMGEDIDPTADKDYIDWEAKYDAIVLQNRVISAVIGGILTVIIMLLRFSILKKYKKIE